MAGGNISTLLSFKMIISQVRRKKMLGFTSDDPAKREEAFRIIRAYEKYISNAKNKEDEP